MNENLVEIWEKAIEFMMSDLDITKVQYDTWIKRLEPFELSDNIIKLKAPAKAIIKTINDRFISIIETSIKAVTNEEYSVEVIPVEVESLEDETSATLLLEKTVEGEEEVLNVDTKLEVSDSKLEDEDNKLDKTQFEDNVTLNSKYTFDSFVVGNSNRFAHAASLAVSEAPARAYNPLFIYGGVGLGKTHLMHAIGHNILKNFPGTRVYYVSSEKFTNELINAIKDDKTIKFRNKYRNVDVLLIDDIQFIAGKESTQEEFFHTFNDLHDAVKQIIISSDRPPKEIPTLEDRLRSRFEWGLLADIQPPDFETRMAILKKKSDMENLDIPNEVMGYIVTKIKTNIRELEGALTRVIAYATLTNQGINLDMATEALKDIISGKNPRQITIELILDVVSNYYNLRIEDFKSSKRTRNIAFPRQIAMYLCRKLTDISLPKIGEAFGGRDHSTVIHAYDKISTKLNDDENLQNAISDIERKLSNL
ncbi:MAG: chromosomal replication initiator protein DnaA [Oscillospiraceae bacterium]|nr:chromosomal replication initiator protein DnaA [Oscillospiraceae bacterium]